MFSGPVGAFSIYDDGWEQNADAYRGFADYAERRFRAGGLPAQQVAQALQLTVLDVRGVKERPSSIEVAGQPAELSAFMPLVLLNPEINPVGPLTAGPEGCLSFPEIYEEITRPEGVEVSAAGWRIVPAAPERRR